MDVCMVRLAVYLFGLIGGFLTPLYLILIRPAYGILQASGGLDTKKATQMRSFLFLFFGWLDAEVFFDGFYLGFCCLVGCFVVGGCLHLATDFNVEFDLGFCSGRTDGYF